MNTISEAIDAIKRGEVVIIADDEDRENEGDFVCAAETITPEIVNFMIKEGRGLLCVSLTDARCKELNLEMMVSQNTSSHETPFTVSVDLLGDGNTTGISAQDRARTIRALVNEHTRPEQFGKPGHIFPLRAKNEGVLRRAGHTEASLDLARMAGLKPAGVLVEILNEDGTMARFPDLEKLAARFNLKLITIKDLITYRMKTEKQINQQIEVQLPTQFGQFTLTAFEEIETNEIHLALHVGTWKKDEPVMVRVHSSCLTGDVFGSCRCDCGPQLHHAMSMVAKEGKGVVLYMKQEGRGIGLLNKLKAYKLQEQGMDTVEANIELGLPMDNRDYGIGAQILHAMGVSKIRLITNNPKKRVGLTGYGLEIVENIPIEIPANPHNEKYLLTKRDKLGHSILKNV